MKLPHVSTYKWRWLRRVVIILTFPWEAGCAVTQTFRCACFWWAAPAVIPQAPVTTPPEQ